MTEHFAHRDSHARMDTELAEDFRVLADSLLRWVEPILGGFAEGLQSAGRRSMPSSDESSSFDSCSWCPVCALAAAIRGERHELLVGLTEHVTAPRLLRELLEEFLGGLDGGRGGESDDDADGAGPSSDGPGSGQTRQSAFVPIKVVVRG